MHGVLILLAMGAGRYFGSEDLLVAEDVTSRLALARDNARLRHEAAEALHLRDQFLSVVAHELKTPITAMLASVQLLQRRAARTPDGEGRDRRALSVLNEQTRRLHRLIVSLLDLSRLQTGQFVLTFAPVDLHVLVPRLTEELQGALDRHVITLRCADTAALGDGRRPAAGAGHSEPAAKRDQV